MRVEEDESHLGERAGVTREVCGRGAERDRRRLVEGVAVDARRDRGERDGVETVRAREREAVLVTGGEQPGHVGTAAVDRSDSVDDVARGEVPRRRDDAAPGGQAVGSFVGADASTRGENRRAAFAMDRSVDAAAPEQRVVGGVHDRVHGGGGEIALVEDERAVADPRRRVRHARAGRFTLTPPVGLPSMRRLVGNDAQNGRRRVVVTGVGLVTPLGTGVEKNWTALLAGRSGIGPITRFPADDFPSRIAGEVRDFAPEEFIERRDLKKMDPFIQFAMAAARMAFDGSGLTITPENEDRVGVIIGVGMGGIASIEQFHTLFLESRLRRVSPFFVAKVISNLAPGQVAIHLGAKGVNFTPTSACASGATAVGEALRHIRHGYQDAIIAGGTEAALCGLGVGGFIAMRAVSTRNDEPERASRPFDRGRDGFVVAEGAGGGVPPEPAHAPAPPAASPAEVVGYGANDDAFHITAPAPGGEGAMRCMRQTLADADLAPEDVDYINAHGTSTQYNDASETEAIKRTFGEHAARLAVSSTKSMTGHTLGAAGGIEAAYTVLALARGVLPPTINYEEPDPACDLDYVPNVARPAAVRVALSNSFGFGGANVCLAFRRWDS